MTEVEIIAALSTIRKERGLTQEEMANHLDISLNQYNKYEKMHSKIRLDTFLTILEKLGIDMYKFCEINSDITAKKMELVRKKLNEALQVIDNKS